MSKKFLNLNVNVLCFWVGFRQNIIEFFLFYDSSLKSLESKFQNNSQLKVKRPYLMPSLMRKTLVQQMTCNVVTRQMLFQTSGAMNNMTISEKNMMGQRFLIKISAVITV